MSININVLSVHGFTFWAKVELGSTICRVIAKNNLWDVNNGKNKSLR
jgi:hypothetical protein